MSKKQKRGEEVKQLIREGIIHLSNKDNNYKYNASELSRFTGITRMTLSRYSSYVNEVLDEIQAHKKEVTGSGIIEQMRDKIERLEKENEELKSENNTLKCDYTEIFQALYENSEGISKIINIMDKKQ